MDVINNPEVYSKIVHQLLPKHYKINSFTWKPLDSYEDINLLIVNNEHENSNCAGKQFVLKISNLCDEQYKSTLDLQLEMMQYLADRGVRTNTPVPTVNGQLWQQYTTHSHNDTVCEKTFHLLNFVPGMTLRQVGNPLSLMEAVGKLAGKVDKLLKDFQPSTRSQLDPTWGPPDITTLRTRLSEYCDTTLFVMAQEICQQYEEKVLPILGHFQKGYIHGDFNDCNIIVDHVETDYGQANQLLGLIDYGDILETYYVYELAVLIADFMSSSLHHTHPVKVAQLLLKGYRQEMDLSETELSALRLFICVRLLQYYIITGDSLKNDPHNPYLQTCLDREKYFEIFHHLYEIDESEFNSKVIR